MISVFFLLFSHLINSLESFQFNWRSSATVIRVNHQCEQLSEPSANWKNHYRMCSKTYKTSCRYHKCELGVVLLLKTTYAVSHNLIVSVNCLSSYKDLFGWKCTKSCHQYLWNISFTKFHNLSSLQFELVDFYLLTNFIL